MKNVCMFVTILVILWIKCGAVSDQTHVSLPKVSGLPSGHRLKRSLLTLGKAAITRLLKKSRVLYSNGIDVIYVKPGGYKEAMADFTALNTAEKVKVMLVNGVLKTVGKIDGRTLILKSNGKTGSAILQISEFSGRQNPLVDPMIDDIFIYTN